jgi:hypothetical protein
MWESAEKLSRGVSLIRPKGVLKKIASGLPIRARKRLCRLAVQVSPFWYQESNPKLLYQALVNTDRAPSFSKGFSP